MTTVQHRVAGWLELFHDLLTQPRGSFPRALLADELAAGFGTNVSWNWREPDGRAGYEIQSPIQGWPPPWMDELFPDLLAAHPLIRWFAASGDPSPMTSGRVPRAIADSPWLPVVGEALEPVGMATQLSIPYRLGPGHHRAFVLARSGDDYSDEDLVVSRHIQTLLLLDRQTTVLASWRGSASHDLTGRELTVLQLISQGLTATAIAHRLTISPRTVHQHKQNLYRKLGVSDRLRAVLAAQGQGLLPPFDPDLTRRTRQSYAVRSATPPCPSSEATTRATLPARTIS